jgi:hypothetical protein
MSAALLELAVPVPGVVAAKGPLVRRVWSHVATGLLSLGLTLVLVALVGARVKLEGWWFHGFTLALTALSSGLAVRCVTGLTGRMDAGAMAALALALLMTLTGSPVKPVPAAGIPGGFVSAALPNRWCFESLLLRTFRQDEEDPARDPAEPYFPSATVRHGVAADTTALIAMLIGFAYADLVIGRAREHCPRPVPRVS